MHSLGIGCRNRAQELIAGAMLLRHGLTLNVKVHDLVCFSKFGPLRQARTVGISSLDKVRPVSVHSLRHLIIFRLPARFLRIERSKHVLQFRGVRGSEAPQTRALRRFRNRDGAIELVSVNRAAGIRLCFNPFPCAEDNELVASQIAGRAERLLVRSRAIELQSVFGSRPNCLCNSSVNVLAFGFSFAIKTDIRISCAFQPARSGTWLCFPCAKMAGTSDGRK